VKIIPIKTPKVIANDKTIFEVIDQAVPTLEEGSVVAVTSKIISICEGNVVPTDAIDRDELITKESDFYLPASLSKYGHHFTITSNTLISVAGIDESNGEGYYILWPKDAQETANQIRKHLAEKHGLSKVGVVITDSTCQPLRRGPYGISLAAQWW
jgi:F420-0:gamma-glutamyl ligase